MKLTAKPTLLLILDGWGYREESTHNAIATASTPTWDSLWQQYPHTLIKASGSDVGLPGQQMGNSEVGHMNMGAGRVIHQALSRINHSITSGDFNQNPTLTTMMRAAKQSQQALHIIGLLSPGGIHSHEHHLHAALSLACAHGISKIFIHPILDGRDTPPKSALASITALEQHCQQLQCGQIASLIGRYYAMDRDQRWERTGCAYQLLTAQQAPYQAPNAQAALENAYERGETDEFLSATWITGQAIQDGDSVLFMNFRADRARQLSHALVDSNFLGFKREQHPKLTQFVCLTEYDANLEGVSVAFKPQAITNCLGEYLANQNYRQLRIAETEKYAHVTFFFNGGREQPFANEDRVLIPSPSVATYDLQPQMSAPQLTERLCAAITSCQYDVIIGNFANPDMVGHTGNFAATVNAIEAIDSCLAQIVTALSKVGGQALITADHGNAEQMFNSATAQAHTAHTNLPVPLLYIGRQAHFNYNNGVLADIAPTLLYLMELEQPSEMTGRILLTLE